MAISKAQQKAVSKYVKEKYDRIEVKSPKGKKAAIQAHVSAKGESVNGFINRAIDHEMERDGAGGPQQVGMVLLSDTLGAAQQAAEATGEAVPVFIHRAVSETAERDRMTREGE